MPRRRSVEDRSGATLVPNLHPACVASFVSGLRILAVSASREGCCGPGPEMHTKIVRGVRCPFSLKVWVWLF